MSSSADALPTVIAAAKISAPLPSDASPSGDRRRVAFVTGAAQGIGLAIALRLAKDGLDVAANDINAEAISAVVAQIEAVGAKSVAVVGDVSDEDAVKRMVSEAVAALGHLDVMVANAGICTVKPILETTTAEFDKIFGVNVRGVHLCYQYAAKQFIRQGTGGKLIAASSVLGFKPMNLLSLYAATKFAIRGINQGAAFEFGKYGITANCYCPGVVDTEMTSVATRQTGIPVEQIMEMYKDIIPLGRTGVPDDIANIVSFLASRNSDYITGQSMIVDGGIQMT